MPRVMVPAKPKVDKFCYYTVISCTCILKLGIATFFNIVNRIVM